MSSQLKNLPNEARLFVGVFSTGVFFADKLVEHNGDYKYLGFLKFSDLELDIHDSCPEELIQEIVDEAKTIQDRRGQLYQVSTCGQTVRLGYSLA